MQDVETMSPSEIAELELERRTPEYIHEKGHSIEDWADTARELIHLAKGHFSDESDRRAILGGVDALLTLIQSGAAEIKSESPICDECKS